MIGRIFRWNRLVFPPWWAIASFLLIYLFFDGHYLYVGRWLDMPRDAEQFVRGRWLAVGAAGVLFAFCRLSVHPAHRREYRDWLACSPWIVGKPLPLGPVHLIPQDGLILGALLLMMRTTGMELIWVVFAFLFAYELGMAGTLLITGERWTAYGLLFGLSIAIRLVPAGAAAIAVLVLLYPLTYLAHVRCLVRFPWRTKTALQFDIRRATLGSPSRPSLGNQSLGFPYQYLAPKQEVPAMNLGEGTVLSLLAGAWGHALIVNGTDLDARTTIAVMFCLIPLLIAATNRLIRYCGNYWPPISLMGRLATGRYIIWRYDRVLVAPLLALLVAAAGWLLFLRTQANLTWGMPAILTLGLWLNLNLGPRLLAWRLTGGHRLGLGPRDRQSFAEP